ncbi:MAG: mechanosensitive ion channel family protein [Vulcanimicrobiaceae bacterium]
MRGFLKFGVAALCAATLAFALPGRAVAQIPGSLLPAELTNGSSELPAGVRRVGNVEIAPVTFENKQLFIVTGPVVLNRQNPGNLTPVEVRVAQIEENLQQVLIVDPNRTASLFGAYDTFYDPRTFEVSVTKVGDQLVLVAGDKSHPSDLDLLTVTAQDARYEGTLPDDLAKRWQRQLQTTLVQALESRQPDVLRRHLALIPKLIGAMVAVSLVLWLLWRWLRRRRNGLLDAVPSGERDRARIDRRVDLLALLLWIVGSTLLGIWVGGILWMLSLFPATASITELFSTQLAWLVAIWFVAGVLDRVANASIASFANAWSGTRFVLREDASRRALRIPTIVRAVEDLKAIVIYLIAAGLSLNLLGLSTASVLTLGAVVAFAASFAAQSIIKDVTNGFLILAEDQYAIGDIVAIGTVAGVVENLTLRVTQLRNDGGRLITIPNNQIAIVENLTRAWSRVDFTIDIAFESDVDSALEVVRGVAAELYRDPQWNALITEEPQVLGVEAISHAGISIRVWIVTAPLQQFAVRREFNRRILAALQKNGIAIGRPQQVVHSVPLQTSPEPRATPEPEAAPEAKAAQ